MNTYADSGARTLRATTYVLFDRPSSAPTMSKEITQMLLYEELARARIRELHRSDPGRRDLRRARVARRWDRVARWAARQSRRYDR
ncbi:hypothetical protein ABZ863_25320 [Saccharomonospora sp. NPDC046836]|uniref:hypothetical protein n=1 Tax=Saccharomonospora sp. NPDC046836 TaxID=3156921 RepID=UPI0033DB17EA